MQVEHLVLAFLGTLVTGLVLACSRFWRKGEALLVLLVLVMNLRYFLLDVSTAIAFFNSIYSPFVTVEGVRAFLEAAFTGSAPKAEVGSYAYLGACDVGNTCSFLPYLDQHPAWATAFYTRFVAGPAMRTVWLRIHIGGTTGAFVLSSLQTFTFPGTRAGYAALHRRVGWVAVLLCLAGATAGLKLGTEHTGVEAYGEAYAVLGWIVMWGCCVGCLILGIRAAVQKDIEAHKVWMNRFYAAEWGSFVAFRLIFFVGQPFLREYRTALVLLAIYGGAPVGIAVGEFVRSEKSKTQKVVAWEMGRPGFLQAWLGSASLSGAD